MRASGIWISRELAYGKTGLDKYTARLCISDDHASIIRQKWKGKTRQCRVMESFLFLYSSQDLILLAPSRIDCMLYKRYDLRKHSR